MGCKRSEVQILSPRPKHDPPGDPITGTTDRQQLVVFCFRGRRSPQGGKYQILSPRLVGAIPSRSFRRDILNKGSPARRPTIPFYISAILLYDCYIETSPGCRRRGWPQRREGAQTLTFYNKRLTFARRWVLIIWLRITKTTKCRLSDIRDCVIPNNCREPILGNIEHRYADHPLPCPLFRI
jgi:hypothetical protein